MGQDYAGFTGETLHGALSEPLDKIRAGKLTPESVRISLLLPDLTTPMGIPNRADAGDSATVRERQTRISSRSLDGIRRDTPASSRWPPIALTLWRGRWWARWLTRMAG